MSTKEIILTVTSLAVPMSPPPAKLPSAPPPDEEEGIEPAPPDPDDAKDPEEGEDDPPRKPPKRPKHWIRDLLVISANAYQVDKDPFEP